MPSLGMAVTRVDIESRKAQLYNFTRRIGGESYKAAPFRYLRIDDLDCLHGAVVSVALLGS